MILITELIVYKIQKYMIRMTFLLAILFALRRLEFTTDNPREQSL